MTSKTPLYPIGGFPKDKFGFPHYEDIQKANLGFQKFYIQELEDRKSKRRKARGKPFSTQWKKETGKTKTNLCKLLNLVKSEKNPKYAKPTVSFKTNFTHNNDTFSLTKFDAVTPSGTFQFTEVFSHSIKPRNNLCILISDSGHGQNGLQNPQELINEYLPLTSVNYTILIPHFNRLHNFSATQNKGLMIQGSSQLAEMAQETIAVLNHCLSNETKPISHLIMGGKGVGATVALLTGAVTTAATGVFALNPIMLGKETTHEALMIPYFNRSTDMEEIIATHLPQNLLISTAEKINVATNKANTLLKTKNISSLTLTKWAKKISTKEKPPLKIIPLKAAEQSQRKFNIMQYKTASQWNSAKPKLLAKYKELCALPKSLKPLAVEQVGESILEDCIRTEYHVQTSLHTRVNLTFYQPKGENKKRATVLCLPGSGSDVAKLESQYVHEVIAKGWNAISIDARVRLYDFHPSIPENTSMIAQSIFDILVCCDWVFKNPKVDASKVATMGVSQGGTHSWMLAALEPRIIAAAVACGFCTYDSVINEKVTEYYSGNGNSFLDSHSIYYYIPYLLQYADQQDLCALIAPRHLMLLCADHDNCFPLNGIRKGGKELAHIYHLMKASPNFKMVEFAGPHSMPLDTREMAYEFFNKIFTKKKSL